MHWHTLWCHGNEGMDWVLDVAPEYGDGQCQRANLILSDKTVQSREWKILFKFVQNVLRWPSSIFNFFRERCVLSGIIPPAIPADRHHESSSYATPPHVILRMKEAFPKCTEYTERRVRHIIY